MNHVINNSSTSTMSDDLPPEFYDESNGLHYTLVGDYYLPDFSVPAGEDYVPDNWARKRLWYLKDHKRWLYVELLTTGQLSTHLKEIDTRAGEWMYRLPKELAKCEDATEDMKRNDPMRWVGLMNNIYARTRELINV